MIRYVKYGKDGPLISRLGFGAMRLPYMEKDGRRQVDFDRSVRVMRFAMKQGVNLFDSHPFYHEGNSELAIGKALQGWKGPRIYVQTKAPWYKEQPRAFFEKLLYEALEKFGVNSIDFLLSHDMNMDAWKKRGRLFIKFSDWALNRGLIRHRGFSSHDKPENVRAFVKTGEFSVMLVSYNWLKPEMRDTIAFAADRGMGVAIMNPVSGGGLAASTPQIRRLMPADWTPAGFAMRYVLATPGVVCALSGMNAVSQVRENAAMAAIKTPMTVRQHEIMSRRLARIQAMARKVCTACGYCMPCKHGVDIPGNFALLVQSRFFGRTRWARRRYAWMRNRKAGDVSAAACQQCGACEPRCPNKIPIMKQLKEAAARFGATKARR